MCAFAFVLGVAFIQGLDRSGKAECLKWADMAEQYPLFYLTPAEAEQCEHYQIPVNAPVFVPEELAY